MFDGPLPEYESPLVRDLRAARALIKQGWCQGTEAENDDGDTVDEYGDEATHFCMVGAIHRVAGEDNEARADLMVFALQPHLPNGYASIPCFNDDEATRWTHVLGAFDAAVKRIQARSAASWKRRMARKMKRIEEMANV